jgi:alpha-1,6-mannosyltransferase
VKKAGVLITAALLCATYLSIALVNLGLDKFHYLLAGGKKFATFPDLQSQLAIGGSYLVLAILYLIWFFTTKRQYRFSYFTSILKNVAIFLILAFVAYPLGNDVYLYLHSGLMNLSNVNPFIVRAGVFASELSPFVDWGQTSTYGPVSQFFFTISAAILAIDPIVAVYSFKAFCLAFHILNGYLIWRLLPFVDRGKIAIAYLVNPLLLMEEVSSAHVDVFISTSVIVLVASLAKQNYRLAFAALWGGFLSKTIPLIWMPLVAVSLVKQKRWQLLTNLGLASIGLIALLSITVMPGTKAWGSLLNPGVAGQSQSSLHAIARFGLDLLRIFVPGSITLGQQQTLLFMLARLTLLGFAGFYAWTVWRIYKQWHYSHPDLVEDIGWVTLVLLLFATPWLMPWYASIVLTIAALIPKARLFGLTSLAFGLSSSAQYLLQGHSSLRSLVSIGIPLLVLSIGAKWLEVHDGDRLRTLELEAAPRKAHPVADQSFQDS